MNKTLVILGAVGGGAALYMLWSRKSSGLQTPLGIPSATNSMGSKPRVDNQSQPWYTGALNFAQAKGQSYAQNPNLAQSDLQSVIHSTADIWGTVSGFFGSSGGTADHVDSAIPDTSSPHGDASINSDPTTLDLPASGENQSNWLGADIGDLSSQVDYNFMYQAPSDSWGMMDYSSADEGMGSDNELSA